MSANLVRFQQEMFYAGKIVRIVAGANVAELKNMGGRFAVIDNSRIGLRAYLRHRRVSILIAVRAGRF